MGQHEHRHVEGRVAPPPACVLEHSSADNDGPRASERFVEHLGVIAAPAAFEAVGFPSAREVVHPLMELLAAFAQR
jgi:hypothetical protein